MPHINRIRVNNVKYNFGTQYYDDFVLRFNGKNTLYDLANGGGKSVLMLLLFQNLIPNCTLDEKQPVEKLFRTDNGSTVIHSLIEWQLDDRYIQDGKKYMLTGFCARKAKEEERETAAIEYYNYVIFYPGYNDNDIVNLPLTDGKERVTYTGLKTYLKDLSKKDMHLDICIFDRKGEYQQFISRYGLYESQWEIIRGINKTEGHVRTYFENNYKTTRKIVEDLLIEEIIQKSYESPENADKDDMAETLVQIKDKLLELTKRKEEIGHYDSQAEILEGFSGRVHTLSAFYEESDSWQDDMVRTYHTAEAKSRKRGKELAVARKEREFCEKHIGEIQRRLDTVRIQENKDRLALLEADTSAYEEKLGRLEADVKHKRDELNLAESMNDYMDYQDIAGKCQTIQSYLGQDRNNQDDTLCELKAMAAYRLSADKDEKQELGKKLWSVEKSHSETRVIEEETKEDLRKLYNAQAVLENQITLLEKEEKDKQDSFIKLRNQVPVLLLENIGRALSEKRNETEADLKAIKDAIDKRQAQSRQMIECNSAMEHRSHTIARFKESRDSMDSFMSEYQKEKEKCDKLFKIYEAPELSALETGILNRLRKVILDGENKREQIDHLEDILSNMRKDSPAVPGKQARQVMEYLRRCHGLTCIYGSDYIKELDAYDKEVLLAQMPFLPYAVIVNPGIRQVKEDRVLLEKDFGDDTVPVVGLDTVLSQSTVMEGEKVLFLSKNPRLFLDKTVLQNAISETEKALGDYKKQLERLKDNEETMEADRQYVAFFKTYYQKNYLEYMGRVENLAAELKELSEK